jgi:hypothetical protein
MPTFVLLLADNIRPFPGSPYLGRGYGSLGPLRAVEARPQNDAVLVGAGDIASCDDLHGAEATAKLLENIPGTVLAVGDLAYPDGSDEQFAKCYDARFEGSISQ